MNIPWLNSILKYRKVLVYSLLILVSILIVVLLIQGPPTVGARADDFVAYWSASRLIFSGENPYSLQSLNEIQSELGLGEFILIPSYYPPHVLPLLMIFSVLPFPQSRILWLLLSIILLIISANILWGIFQGQPEKRRMIFLCIFTSVPAYFAMMEGQIIFLVLIGISMFIFFADRGRLFLAGIFLLLLTFKIQLIYLLWIAIILWMLNGKNWRVLIGFLVAVLTFSGIAILLHPPVFSNYFVFMSRNAPEYCNHPTIYSLLCALGGGRIYWLRFLAPLLGVIWLIFFWWKDRNNWIWREKISLIIIISVLTAPFAWMHDEVLYLIPVIEIAILMFRYGMDRKGYLILSIYLGMNFLAFIQIPTSQYNQIEFLWMPLLFLGLYIFGRNVYSK